MRILLVLLLLLTYNAHAAEESRFVKLKASVTCGPWEEVEKLLEKYGEKPFLRAITNRYNEIGNSAVGTIIFVNPISNSFSIFEEWNEETYCLISAGQYLQPYQD